MDGIIMVATGVCSTRFGYTRTRTNTTEPTQYISPTLLHVRIGQAGRLPNLLHVPYCCDRVPFSRTIPHIPCIPGSLAEPTRRHGTRTYILYPTARLDVSEILWNGSVPEWWLPRLQAFINSRRSPATTLSQS